MPYLNRPDGAVIHYETFGRGHPLLCFAPGGVNSEITFWERSRINPLKVFADEFMVIGMDQRNAGESWAPAAPPSYELTVGDQIAVLDALGVEKAHVMGGCIGVAYVLRILQEAPGRITAAVGQDPVGLDHTNSRDVFTAMFRPTVELARSGGVTAVIESAVANPLFVMNNAAGPFARRLHGDPAFRESFAKMSADEYVALIKAYEDGVWPDREPYISVDEAWVESCQTPLLILPGSDAFHPTSVAHRLCQQAANAQCLDVDCRSDEKLPATIETVRAFLRRHRP